MLDHLSVPPATGLPLAKPSLKTREQGAASHPIHRRRMAGAEDAPDEAAGTVVQDVAGSDTTKAVEEDNTPPPVASNLRKILETDPDFAADYCHTMAYTPDTLWVYGTEEASNTLHFSDGSEFGNRDFIHRMATRLIEVCEQRIAVYESALARGLTIPQTFYLLKRFNERLPEDYRVATGYAAG